MTSMVTMSGPADGMIGEVGRRIVTRPDGRTAAARGVGEVPYDPRIKALAENWDCTVEDFALIGANGLKGTASTITIAQAARVGRMACRLTEGSFWTAADCCLILSDAKHKYDKIAAALGISADRAEKLACLARAFGKDERHPNLPLAHHEEVRALTPAAREDILRRAETEKLPVTRVRELVREVKPVAARSNEGRKSRSARTPVAPSNVPSVTIAPSTQSSAVVTMPVSSNGAYVPDPNPAPAGKAPAPSVAVAPIGLRLCLMDRDLSNLVLEKVGRNQAAAESLLAEIVRAHFAANK